MFTVALPLKVRMSRNGFCVAFPLVDELFFLSIADASSNSEILRDSISSQHKRVWTVY